MQIVIDKENLINVFSIALYIVSGKLDYENVKNTATELIEQVGYIPFSEPKIGKWIDRSEGGRILYPWLESCKCNQCGDYGSGAWNFCPNCGSKMKEEEE